MSDFKERLLRQRYKELVEYYQTCHTREKLTVGLEIDRIVCELDKINKAELKRLRGKLNE